MQTNREFDPKLRRLERLMYLELGLGSGDLMHRVKRARGRLPRQVKRDMAQVAQAAHLVGHPKIAPQINRRDVNRAYTRARRYLQGPTMAEARKGRILSAGAALAVNLMLVFMLVLSTMLWQGVI